MCLWSKDAQQKKRKRWTDGIARFSPASGLLSIWDQVYCVRGFSMEVQQHGATLVFCTD